MIEICGEKFTQEVVTYTLTRLMDVRTNAIVGETLLKDCGICGNVLSGVVGLDLNQMELLGGSFFAMGMNAAYPLGVLKKNNWKGKHLRRRLILMNKLELLWREKLGLKTTCWQVDLRFSRLVDPVEWTGQPYQHRLLNLGVIHTTKESALFFAKRQLKGI